MTQQNQDNLQFPRFIELQSVDSTNNYALSLLRHPNLTERQRLNLQGTAVFTHEQWKGKGQRGKNWISKTGETLPMSLIVAPAPLKLPEQFTLSAITAVIVSDFISKMSDKAFCIKWPNDIYFQDRKAGGILIENIISGDEWKWAVIGIGLNINQTEFDPALPNPVSLKQITGRNFNCVELAKSLSQKIFERIADCRLQIADCGFRFLKEYNSRLYKRGNKVKFRKDNRVFEATIKEVTTTGQLVVEHSMEQRFHFGEVVWII